MLDAQFVSSQQLHLVYILFKCRFSSYFYASGAVTSFNITSGSEGLSGHRVQLICTLTSYTNLIYIYKSVDNTDLGTFLAACDQTKCSNPNPNYSYSTTGKTVVVTIKNLQRADDQKVWTCRTTTQQNQLSEKQFYLTVYSEYDYVSITFLPNRQSLFYFSSPWKFCLVHGLRQLTRGTTKMGVQSVRCLKS